MSPEQLISQMLAMGYRITRRQLKRWQADDLIPRPKQTRKKGEAGSKTLYRNDTIRSVVAICLLRTKIRSTERIRWALWKMGCPILTKYWKPKLVSAAKRTDRYYQTYFKKEFVDSEPELIESAEISILKLSRESVNNPLLGPIKQNLGASDFAVFMQTLLEVPIRTPLAVGSEKRKTSKSNHDDPNDFNQNLLSKGFKKPSISTDSILTVDNYNKEFNRIKEMRNNQLSFTSLVKRKTSASLSESARLLTIAAFQAELLATQTLDSRWNALSALKPDAIKLSISEEATCIVGLLLILEDEEFRESKKEFLDPKGNSN